MIVIHMATGANKRQIIHDGLKLDDDYQNWDSFMRLDKLFGVKELKTSPRVLGKFPVHLYNDFLTGWLWSNYYLCRIHLHEVLKHCIFLLRAVQKAVIINFDTSDLDTSSNVIIQDMISHICSSIPYFLGEIDGQGEIVKDARISPHGTLLIVTGMYVAMTSLAPGETESWLRSKLETTSSSTGMPLPAGLARRPKANPWNLK